MFMGGMQGVIMSVLQRKQLLNRYLVLVPHCIAQRTVNCILLIARFNSLARSLTKHQSDADRPRHTPWLVHGSWLVIGIGRQLYVKNDARFDDLTSRQ